MGMQRKKNSHKKSKINEEEFENFFISDKKIDFKFISHPFLLVSSASIKDPFELKEYLNKPVRNKEEKIDSSFILPPFLVSPASIKDSFQFDKIILKKLKRPFLFELNISEKLNCQNEKELKKIILFLFFPPILLDRFQLKRERKTSVKKIKKKNFCNLRPKRNKNKKN
ncbi:hypothetical protein BpHYR1_022334 [Brachionus plicatilis]|uniref:Uncharacterized protein n=1 Tax=Brachionus plicatilis TaxID=10195 RepID=A0A3M7T2L9_BRAPC|nr:hypothetical protein BpHYR1_022334 [Brachionus plicatilis]